MPQTVTPFRSPSHPQNDPRKEFPTNYPGVAGLTLNPGYA